MAMGYLLAAAFCAFAANTAAQQVEPPAARSTTERPNLSAPGLEQTLSGIVMDATCSAIADSRSELTRTPRIVPPRNNPSSPVQSEPNQRSRASTVPVSDSDIPEKYKGCKLKSSTTSFAVYVNGRVYMLDRVSNQMMQEHLMNTKADGQDGTSLWITRTVVGSATSDDVLTLRTVRQQNER
jgi:hypothetical protein